MDCRDGIRLKQLRQYFVYYEVALSLQFGSSRFPGVLEDGIESEHSSLGRLGFFGRSGLTGRLGFTGQLKTVETIEGICGS